MPREKKLTCIKLDRNPFDSSYYEKAKTQSIFSYYTISSVFNINAFCSQLPDIYVLAKSTSKRHPEYFFYFPKTDGNVEAINSVFKLRKADILRLVAGNDDMFNKYVNDAVIMVTRRVWGSRSIYAFNESSSYLGYVASNNSLKSVSLKAAQERTNRS